METSHTAAPGGKQLAVPALRADRGSATPVFRQIAEHIEHAARDDGGKSGMRLPSEAALSTAFAVNRATIRRALQELVDNGVAVQVRGRGTFLTEPRVIEQPLASSLISFSEALNALGIAFTTEVISIAIVKAAGTLAARLATTGLVHAIRRLRRVDGVPMILLDNFLPCALFPDLPSHDIAGNQLFAVLAEKYQRAPFDGTRTFEATLAQPETAALLEIGAGAPVMYAEQTTRDAGGTPIEASDMWLPGRRFRLSAHLFREAADDTAHRGRR